VVSLRVGRGALRPCAGPAFPEKAGGDSSSLLNPNSTLEDFSGKGPLRLGNDDGVA
jgi:hypothetical protein